MKSAKVLEKSPLNAPQKPPHQKTKNKNKKQKTKYKKQKQTKKHKGLQIMNNCAIV